MRRHRVWIVAIVVGALVFAQAAASAHACALLTAPSSGQTGASAPPMHSGCAGIATHAHSTVNVCVSHCVGSDQSNASADVPTAAIAPQPALNVRVSVICAPTHWTLASLISPAAAPPPHLRFARFLI